MNRAVSLTYLGHSGFAVDTKDDLLIFDYWETGSNLLRPIIGQKGKKIYFFNSHDHHDHYDKTIEGYKKSFIINGHFTGWKFKEGYIYIKPYDTYKLDDIEVTTFRSNDSGVAFLVKSGGSYIFHGGDLAGWEDESWISFTNEIDRIKEMGIGLDAVMLAVTSFSGVIQPTMVKAAKYFLDTVHIKYFIPMHANSREYLYKEFKRDNFPDDERVICPEFPGQTIRLDL